MAQVSSLAEFRNALRALDPLIQIATGFSIDSQISIEYTVTIESLTPDTPAALVKDSSYAQNVFRILNGGALTLNNIILDGNAAGHPVAHEQNRSLIYVNGGALSLTGKTVIMGGRSALEGGGLYLNSSASRANALSVGDQVQIIHCTARTNGGGIMIMSGNPQDTFHIAGDVLIGMNKAVNGAGIYMRSCASNTGISLSLSDSVHIIGNRAVSAGGGLYFCGYQNNGSAASRLILSGDALISGNQAANGAGLYFAAATAQDRCLITGNAAITQNMADRNGGACCYTAENIPADFNINGGALTDNCAGTGGAVYLSCDAGGTVCITRSTLTGNKACSGFSGAGGGLWIQNRSDQDRMTLQIRNTTLAQNQAAANGGGILLNSSAGGISCSLLTCNISENTAVQNGGGLSAVIRQAGDVSIRGCQLLRNTAGTGGGGLYLAETGGKTPTAVTLDNTVVGENTAGTEGGGVYLASGSNSLSVAMTDCTVLSNTAKENGGGIWNSGFDTRLTVDGSTSLTGNSARLGNGGGLYYDGGTGTVQFHGNVKITDNHADTAATGNTGQGGGICLASGRLNIQDSVEIAFNTAGNAGGALHTAGTSTAVIEGGRIHDNRCNSKGGALSIREQSTVTITGGDISDNQAPYGNDLYNQATLFTGGSRVFKGGVYIENRAGAVKLTGKLAEPAAVQLETSSYVSPNDAGIPIIVADASASYPSLSRTDAGRFIKPSAGFKDWKLAVSNDQTQILLIPPAGQTITFKGNDDNGPKACNLPLTLTVPFGASIVLPATVPTRPGWRFRGWNTYQHCEGETFYPGGVLSNVITDVTLYAVWDPADC